MPKEIDWDHVDDAALALLGLTLHDGDRVWKGLDWDITDRLYEKGYISDPRSKAQSVVLFPEGRERAERLLHGLFGRNSEGG